MAKEKQTDYEVSEGNIFAAIGRTNADELLARAELLDKVSTLIENSKLLPSEVAKKLGITEPEVSMLINGQLSAFTFSTLNFFLRCSACY